MNASKSTTAIPKDARIYIAGHTGLVGSAIHRGLKKAGYQNFIVRDIEELDLTDLEAVKAFFDAEKPEYVFLAAAKVGGIMANNTYPADFFYINSAIQNNVIHQSYLHDVKRLLFLGSSCIYPRECPQPIKEEYLLSGPLEPTNRPYAIAKIAGIEMCWSYNRQYDTRYMSVMPTNLYGPGDNFDLKTSHVLPAIIRKMHEAKDAGSDSMTLWGTGSPKREFLFSEDLADAVIFLMNLPDDTFRELTGDEEHPPLINIGCGEDQTIAELAEVVRDVVGFEGKIDWDTSKPDGTPRKLLDVSRLFDLGWRPSVPLREGIQRAYDHFLEKYVQV
ncbi:MAG: GDP-L-fucose synthase family protein [Candidatus Sumerlaeia bacterium]